MRHALFASVTAFGMMLGVAALAQTSAPGLDSSTGARPGHQPGVGLSEPTSSSASNITSGDTHSRIAPRLPGSAASTDETPGQLLRVARQALDRHQTGAAQEALERAETRLLDRSTAQGMTDTPSTNPVAQTIAQAREALGHHDVAGAQSLISKAMTQTPEG